MCSTYGIVSLEFEKPMPESDVLPPRGRLDPVIEAYMGGIDRTLLRENLKLSVEDRIRQLQAFQAAAVELQRAGREARKWKKQP